jgi:acyl carrier protein
MSDRIKQVFATVLGIPVESIGDNASPDNTPKWDSVASIKLALALEEEFAIKLRTREIISMRNMEMVKKVLRGKGASV